MKSSFFQMGDVKFFGKTEDLAEKKKSVLRTSPGRRRDQLDSTELKMGDKDSILMNASIDGSEPLCIKSLSIHSIHED